MCSRSRQYRRIEYHQKLLAQKWSCAKSKPLYIFLYVSHPGDQFWKGNLCVVSSRRGFCFWKVNISGILEHPHFQKVCISWFHIFFKNCSPEHFTMLMRRAAKFWVEPRSPFSEISHQKFKTTGKLPNIVSWLECRLFEFPFTTHDWWGTTHDCNSNPHDSRPRLGRDP